MTDRLDPSRMALSAAALHVAGGCLVLVTLVVPGHEPAVRAVPVIAGIAIAFGIVLAIGGRRLPHAAHHVAPALGAALIGLVLALDEGRGTVAYGTLYTFVAIYVFYWFSTRAALVHVGFIVVSCAVGLSARSGDAEGAANLVVYCGAAAVTGGVVAWLVRQIRAAARIDGLTGLPNRRTWEAELERELARGRRDGSPVCVAILDLDHFKDVNDRGGHAAGDARLREVARAWSTEVREVDLLARWGGDEFALVLPGCPPHDAQAIVERMRRSMPRTQGVSAGVACWSNDESVDALVDRADRALYDAKRDGRDRTVVAAASTTPPTGT